MTLAVTITDNDPSVLSAQQRRCLRTVKVHHCFRRQGGFGRAPNSVALDVATSMIRRGLCRQDYSGRTAALVLTGAGEAVLAVMEQRAQRKRPIFADAEGRN